jgi:molybdate transport system substrate-binding protein
MDEGQADVFLTYCTNAVAAQAEVPRLRVVQMPSELQVGAAYAMTVSKTSSPTAASFAKALLDSPAQAIFTQYGFANP